MTPDVKTVRGALRSLKLKPQNPGKTSSHAVWIDAKGRKVELAKDGNDVPDLFVHILAKRLEFNGICSRKEFKQLLRSN
jgi:hypothetical protein